MSIAKATAKSRWKGALLAAAAAGISVPAVANATLTINLQLAPGAGGATSMFVTGGKTNADIPVYVYATVTGSAALTAPLAPGSTAAPATTGNFDGLQYLYYNILNSNSTGTEITGGIDSSGAFAPTLNSVLGFNGGNAQPNPNPGVVGVGAQAGTVVNSAASGTTAGLSVGSFFNLSSCSSTSQITTALEGIAKPRSNSPVLQNYAQATTNSNGVTTYNSIGNDGVNIIVNSATSVSFLVETLYFKPTAFTPSTTASAVKTTFSVQVPNLSQVNLAGANWFQDLSSYVSGSQPSSTMNGNYSAGSSVTFEESLPADINGDGKVNISDLLIIAQNYNKTGTSFATGDLNGDGKTNISDLLLVAQEYNQTLATITPSVAAELDSYGDADFTAQFEALVASVNPSAVPEPVSLGLVSLGAVGLMSRRRRVSVA